MDLRNVARQVGWVLLALVLAVVGIWTLVRVTVDVVFVFRADLWRALTGLFG